MFFPRRVEGTVRFAGERWAREAARPRSPAVGIQELARFWHEQANALG